MWLDGRGMYAQATQMKFAELRKIKTEPLIKTPFPGFCSLYNF
jgi:hypothetical protein